VRGLDPSVQVLVDEVERLSISYRAVKRGAELRIAKLVREQADAEITSALLSLRAAMHVALDAGATQVALKAVTTKDRLSFKALLGSAAAVIESGPQASTDLRVAWEGGNLRVTLDPSVNSSLKFPVDPDDPALWTGLFYVDTTAPNGQHYVDPVDDSNLEHGVRQWINSGRANEERILEWVREHPAA
jgi:hypothetical protein